MQKTIKPKLKKKENDLDFPGSGRLKFANNDHPAIKTKK